MDHSLVNVGVDCDDGSVEWLWSTPVDGGYRLENIPLFAYSLAKGDVVSTEASDIGLRFAKLTRPSGHSTIRVLYWGDKESFVAELRERLRCMGCESELGHSSIHVGFDVPTEPMYREVVAYLKPLEAAGELTYEESCLGFPPVDEGPNVLQL